MIFEHGELDTLERNTIPTTRESLRQLGHFRSDSVLGQYHVRASRDFQDPSQSTLFELSKIAFVVDGGLAVVTIPPAGHLEIPLTKKIT